MTRMGRSTARAALIAVDTDPKLLRVTALRLLHGEQREHSTTLSPFDCRLRFPGQYADEETGLNYNYFRHYGPETARYATLDPLGLVPSPNAVAYVRNSHTWTDHLGPAGDDGLEWSNPEDLNFSHTPYPRTTMWRRCAPGSGIGDAQEQR